MNFVQSVLLLAGLTSGILVPIFVGHALSTHHNEYYLYGGIALVVAAVILWIHAKTAPEVPESSAHH